MTDYGASDTSTTTLGTNQFPISEVYVPNTGLRALGGGPKQTDGTSKDYAPALMYIQDGSDVAKGAQADTAWTLSGSATEIALLKKIALLLNGTLTTSGSVSVSNFPATQPVSATSLPLPTGAATSAKQPAPGSAGTASADVLTVQGIASMTALKVDGSGVTQPVSGTFWQTTQPISGTVTANAGTGSFNNASIGSTGAAVPTSASYIAGNKAGNLTGVSLDGSGNLNVNVAAGGGSGGTSSTFNAAFPATGTAVGASDGTNMKSLLVDASGFLKVNVSAGGGAGGTSSSFGSAFPATGTASGFSDGTNMQGARAFDADTGAGTQYVAGSNLRISASGGSIEAKGQQTMVNSIPVTLASDQGAVSIATNSSVNVAQVAGTTTDTNSGNKSAGTQRVVLATDQPQLTNALKVDGSAVTQPVSGTVTANAGTGTFTNQQSNITTDYDTGAGTQTMTMMGVALPASGGAVAGGTATNPLRTDPTGTTTQPVNGTVTANAGTNLNTSLLALESGGHLANIDTHIPALGSAVSVSSSPVVIASDQAPLVSATATRSNVTAAVADTSLLASNTSRKGAIFYNDSTAILYLGYGAAAASTTSYSVQVPAGGYFEMPPQPIYTGAIRGIWSAANGAVRITELS